MRIQPIYEESSQKRRHMNICRRSCALATTTAMSRGATMRDARPAAAAEGSKWPMFAFKEAHYTTVSSRPVGSHIAPTTAPTYKKRFKNRGQTILPQSGPRAPFPCRALRGRTRPHYPYAQLRSAASTMTRLAPSNSHWDHLVTLPSRKPRTRPHSHLTEMPRSPLRDNTRRRGDRTCDTVRAPRASPPPRTRAIPSPLVVRPPLLQHEGIPEA